MRRPVLPDPRLHVLMVNTHQTGGGAGRVGELLAAGLRRAGDDVRAFVRASVTGHLHQCAAGSWRETRAAAWLARRGFTDLGHLSSFCWQTRPDYAVADVVHLHNLHGDFVSLAALPLWSRQKPLVWTLHDCWPLTGGCAAPAACTRWRRSCGRCPQVGVYPVGGVDRTSVYRRIKPWLWRWARPRIVTPSHWLERRVAEIPALQSLPRRVIRPPIDCETFAPRPDLVELRRQLGLTPERPTVVLAGNNWSDALKGGTDGIVALRGAAAAVPKLQVLVVGRGSAELLAATRLTGRALPFQHERHLLAAAYACADVCLFPSRAENYPLTVLEALACETPVVGYDVGGVPEQIEHLQTGYVAPDGQPAELAAGLVLLLRAPNGVRAMGRRGRAFVLRTSSIAAVVAEYREEYRRAIAAWSRRRGRSSPRTRVGRWEQQVARALGWEATELETPAGILAHRECATVEVP